jgi:SAM-dependent methyltransferase
MNRLPSRFSIEIPTQKTPIELFNFLQDLYSEERRRNQEDPYLAYHGTPSSLLLKIYTFDWYLPFLPVEGKALDWGCNHAPDSCLIRAAFGGKLQVHACDFRDSGSYPVFLQASGAEYRKLTDCLKLPYENNFFDVIIASGALEHAAFDYASLQELYRVLKPECKLIITYLPNKFSYHEWIQKTIRHKEFHMRCYSFASAKTILKSNGFFPDIWGYHTFFWEWRAVTAGIKNPKNIAKFLYCVFPINLICGCLKMVATKKLSM